jgi:hypothetical protein
MIALQQQTATADRMQRQLALVHDALGSVLVEAIHTLNRPAGYTYLHSVVDDSTYGTQTRTRARAAVSGSLFQ